MKLRGSVAVVTGASSGIGRATAMALAGEGVDLALGARRADRLDETAEACRALGVRCLAIPTDVTRDGDCERLVHDAARELGPIDILVNCAGFALFDSAQDAKPDEMQTMMQTNYFGAVRCIQAVLPSMLERGSGSIVNIGSTCGIIGYARMGGYCATKFALGGYSESLRDELIDRGIRVALVCPNTTSTDFFRHAEAGKMPRAYRLVPAISPDRVARTVVRAVVSGKARTIIPLSAALYMRFKELFPRTAHYVMRRVSSVLERTGRT